MSIPNSSIETAIFGIRRIPEKLNESNLEGEVRLGSNVIINDILITRHPWQCMQHLILLQFETLNPFNYCSWLMSYHRILVPNPAK